MENLRSRILLVEDDQISQYMTLETLQQLNCDIDVAKKGWEALTLIKEKIYNLIFMDIGLPDIDGFMVTEAIRKQEGEKKPTPIIALTAHKNENHKQRCFASGANEVIVKPLTLASAQEMLKKFILR